MMKSAIPISTYSVVHIGPKTQLGGLNSGLSSFGYHDFTPACVAALPIPAAASGHNAALSAVGSWSGRVVSLSVWYMSSPSSHTNELLVWGKQVSGHRCDG